MLFFVAEGTGHTAATGWNGFNPVIFGEGKHGHRVRHRRQGLLLAVTVQFDQAGFFCKQVFIQATCFDFSCDEFINQKDIFRQFFGCSELIIIGQVHIFIPESQDGAGLNPQKRVFLIYQIFQQANVLIGNFFGFP